MSKAKRSGGTPSSTHSSTLTPSASSHSTGEASLDNSVVNSVVSEMDVEEEAALLDHVKLDHSLSEETEGLFDESLDESLDLDTDEVAYAQEEEEWEDFEEDPAVLAEIMAHPANKYTPPPPAPREQGPPASGWGGFWDTVQTTLDVAGIFDPTGIADACIQPESD